MNYVEYINKRIEEIFNDLAAIAGDELAEQFKDNPDEMPAGALAWEMMDKSIKLQNAWKEICRESH